MYSHSVTYELEQTLMEYFIITFLLGTILHRSVCVLLTEALAAFCSRLPFQGCFFQRTVLEDRDNISLQSREQICLLFSKTKKTHLSWAQLGQVCSQHIIKDLRSLTLGFLSCCTNPLHAQHPLSCSILPPCHMGVGGRGALT